VSNYAKWKNTTKLTNMTVSNKDATRGAKGGEAPSHLARSELRKK